ncbi:MAG: dihydroorotase [Oscillospiraceae bacterium]|nr:dihydroorotase [Oscillospiraceae bacterium]
MVLNVKGFDGGYIELSDVVLFNDECGCGRIEPDSIRVVPALFDAHIHTRDPGYTYKEDIYSAAQAALYGGFSDVAAMPNTKPACDSPEIIADICKRAEALPVNLHQIACVTVGSAGEKLCDLELLAAAGASGFSDDGKPIQRDDIMESALKTAFALGLPLISHCECPELVYGGVINKGIISEKLGLPGISNDSEYEMIKRHIALASKTDTAVHIAHVSTKEGFTLIREAKKAGIGVTCETCPHYFFFNEAEVYERGTYAKMNPPLRSEADRLAAIEAICDGTVDIIVTDHAPHTDSEKRIGDRDLSSALRTAPFGVIGLESSFAAAYTALVKSGYITFTRLICLMSDFPRRLFGIKPLNLDSGCRVALFDTENEFVYTASHGKSKSHNSVFEGVSLFGRPVGYAFGKKINNQI